MTTGRRLAPLFSHVLLHLCMSITYDFQIVGSNISGISLVLAQNEDAFSYLVDEAHMTVFSDGTAALFNERVGDFISDAEHAHMCCNYV